MPPDPQATDSDIASAMAPGSFAIEGALERLADGTLDGWCRSPDRPDARMTVEILDGDSIALSLLAQHYRQDLARAGIGDGRHGFQARLPDHPPGAGGRLIRAREKVSGVVFASLVEDMASAGRTGIERLDRSAAEIGALQAEIAALRSRLELRRQTSRPATALRDMSVLLAARSWRAPQADPQGAEFALAAALESLQRQFAPITLAVPQTPAVSLVLLAARDIAHTMAALAALSGLSRGGGVEIILADDGFEPRTALIHGLVRGLRVATTTQRATSGAAQAALAIGAAAALANGETLVVLACGTAPPSAAALAALLRVIATHKAHVLPGAAGRASLARWGLAAPDRAAEADTEEELLIRLSGSIGLMLALPRQLWEEIGGLDAQLADGAGLECADAALKAWLLGSPIGRATEPWEQQSAGLAVTLPAATPEIAWQAAAAFRARWGDLGLEQEVRT